MGIPSPLRHCSPEMVERVRGLSTLGGIPPGLNESDASDLRVIADQRPRGRVVGESWGCHKAYGRWLASRQWSTRSVPLPRSSRGALRPRRTTVEIPTAAKDFKRSWFVKERSTTLYDKPWS